MKMVKYALWDKETLAELCELKDKEIDRLLKELAQTYYSCRVVYKGCLHSDDKEAAKSFRSASAAVEALKEAK